jgi:hypothetical protein
LIAGCIVTLRIPVATPFSLCYNCENFHDQSMRAD